MTRFVLTLLLSWAILPLFAQMSVADSQYEPNGLQPLGSINPAAPEEIKQFDFLVDVCDCSSINRNPDGSWQDTLDMVWSAQYTLNGTAVQDFTWREGGFAASSMRQFDTLSHQWVVTYFGFPAVSTSPGVWLGGMEGEKMVLKKPQKAPNGMKGQSILTFYDISATGFRWQGKWMSDDGKLSWPFWQIDCVKRQ